MKKLTYILLVISLFYIQFITAQTNKIDGVNKANSVALFWDTSLSMNEKNLSLELNFLDYYISNKSDFTIQLIKFSNQVNAEQTYQIKNGDWSSLKQDLTNTTYDGSTALNPLNDKKYQLNEVYMVFTDGYQNQKILTDSINKPLIVVSSIEKTFFGALQSKSDAQQSYFLDLNTQSLTEALAKIGIKVQTVVGIKSKGNKTANIKNLTKVSGTVYSSEGVLEGVNVVIASKEKGVVTDKDGKFSIEAKIGDELKFSYLGFKTYHEIVSDPEIKVTLLSSETRLNTVVIEGKRIEELKEDSHGLASDKDKKRGYAQQTLTSENFNAVETNIAQNVQGRISGASLGQTDDISQMIIRGGGTILMNQYPLIVLDGVPLARANSGAGGGGKLDLSFIDSNNVDKIVVLKGLAATNRYGSEGGRGVIEITTKTATYNKKDYLPVDKALLHNNVYNETLNKNQMIMPYLTDLNTSKSAEDAYQKYLILRETYGDSITFYFDVSDYFKQWNNLLLSERILSNVLENNFNNPVGLLALAFKYEANRDLDNEIYIDKRLLRLQPKNAQSYIDMAKNYVDQKFFTKAFYLYKSMVENTIESMNFSGANTSLLTAFKSLIQNNKELFTAENINPEFYKKENINARLYFEWTSPDLAFELQFVNPQNRFFSWTHSVDNDAKRIKDEKEQGFTSEEFLLIDAEKGEWIINLTNFGASAIKDQILKMVIYKNYGTPQQTKEVKVVNLEQYYQKASLIKIKI